MKTAGTLHHSYEIDLHGTAFHNCTGTGLYKVITSQPEFVSTVCKFSKSEHNFSTGTVQHNYSDLIAGAGTGAGACACAGAGAGASQLFTVPWIQVPQAPA